MTNETRVRYFRFMNGEMSQAELADRAGVSRQTIGAIEGGDYSPSVWLAIRLVRILGVTVEELFISGEELS